MKDSLSRTRGDLLGSLSTILPVGRRIDNEVLEHVEEVLYEADLGVHAVEKLIAELRQKAFEINSGRMTPLGVMKAAVADDLKRLGGPVGLSVGEAKPFIILVIGVNGVGKTTTIGKLALRFRAEGRTVLLAASDTFRAAAIEQLEVWAERSGAEFIKAHIGADAASVAYDAVMRAKARSTDVVIIDTAGRIHTSYNLLGELKKIRRVVEKADKSAPHEILLIIDATTGQNALSQAETFKRELDVTGIAITKLDGTAKGGMVVSISDRLGIPVKLIGMGEGIEDLRDFDPETYAEALFAP